MIHYEHDTECPELGPVCATRSEPPQRHVQDFQMVELRGSLEWAPFDHVSFEAQLPFRIVSKSVVYKYMDGVTFTPDYVDIHHRNETLSGIGDVIVSARGHGKAGPLTLGGRLGLSLPTGRTVENPFALGNAGVIHQHTQHGTGTVNPIVAFDLSWASPSRTWGVSAFVLAQLVPYASSEGYQAGHRVVSGVTGRYSPVTGLDLSLGLNVAHEATERWDGEVLEDGNLGRTDLLAAIGIGYSVNGFRVGLDVRVPFYTAIAQEHSHGTAGGSENETLTFPVIIGLTLDGVMSTTPRKHTKTR